MESIELHATPRSIVGKKVKRLRRQNIVPGIIYGHGIGSVPVQFQAADIRKTINQAGSSTTVQVYVEGVEDPYLAIFRDVQYHPIKRDVIHLDLQALSLEETVRVPVTVVLVGDTTAVEEEGGVLIQQLNELEIESLPTALVPSIEVDVSQLTEIGQSILVGDITAPAGVTILNSPDDIIAQITWIEEEITEEEEELEIIPESVEVEVIGKGPEAEEETEAFEEA